MPNRDSNRSDSQKEAARHLAEHVRWLIDSYDRRAEGVRARATVVLTVAGTLVALVPRTVDHTSGCWAVILAVAGLLAGIAAGGLALAVLFPRNYQSRLSVDELDSLIRKVRDDTDRTYPPAQFMVDLAGTDAGSWNGESTGPLRSTIDDFDRRSKLLAWAYVLVGVTFVLAMAANLTAALMR